MVFYIPAPFLGHASRHSVATDKEKGRAMFSDFMWVNRAAAKLDVMSTSRHEEGARSGWGERAVTDCSLLTRLTTLATNGLLARRNNFRDLFYLNYTKHGGHSFLTKARFFLIALHKPVRASHVVSNKEWVKTIAAFKIKKLPRTTY